MMKAIRKIFLVLACCVGVLGSAHATVRSLTATGTILGGSDALGLFGAAGRTFAGGESIEWVQNFDTSVLSPFSDPGIPAVGLIGSISSLATAISIDGVTRSGSSPLSAGAQLLFVQNGVTAATGTGDGILGLTAAVFPSGIKFLGVVGLGSDVNSIIPSLNLDLPLLRLLQPGDQAVGLLAYQYTSPVANAIVDQFVLFLPTQVRLDVTAVVPEPETYALFFAGFGVVLFAAGRRRRARGGVVGA